MRTVIIGLMIVVFALAASGNIASDPKAPPLLTPGYLTSLELSHDNGNIMGDWLYLSGSGAYVGDQYDLPSGGPWYLSGIKYYVVLGWPDPIMQGYGVACWKMESGVPGTLVWPTDGIPIYNPNTGGHWIIQTVEPNFNLSANCPNGFLAGINFMYNYPNNDDFGIDDTGPCPYDWSHPSGGSWGPAPYGKGSARAIVNNEVGVETMTIGQIRALYR